MNMNVIGTHPSPTPTSTPPQTSVYRWVKSEFANCHHDRCRRVRDPLLLRYQRPCRFGASMNLSKNWIPFALYHFVTWAKIAAQWTMWTVWPVTCVRMAHRRRKFLPFAFENGQSRGVTDLLLYLFLGIDAFAVAICSSFIFNISQKIQNIPFKNTSKATRSNLHTHTHIYIFFSPCVIRSPFLAVPLTGHCVGAWKLTWLSWRSYWDSTLSPGVLWSHFFPQNWQCTASITFSWPWLSDLWSLRSLRSFGCVNIRDMAKVCFNRSTRDFGGLTARV